MTLLNTIVGSMALAKHVDTPIVPRRCQCASLQPPQIEGATIINSTGTMLYNQTGKYYEDGVDVCSFEVYLTHSDANDAVRILTWLPTGAGDNTPWNGRYQGTGGGGFWAGFLENAIGPAAALGHAASSTDGGYDTSDGEPSPWSRDPQLVINFGYLSFHEMTIIGKAATNDFYGRPADYSYWTGCSMGGRQGHSMAQKYPEHYDGILSVAAPTGWDKIGAMVFWPYLVQSNGEDGFVGLCKLDALTAASVETCKVPQNAEDGVITDPRTCGFQAASQVRTTVTCSDGTQSVITDYDAAIWESIRNGPRRQNGDFLWWGLEAGTSYNPWANEPPTNVSNAADWVVDFLLKEPDYDIATIDFDLYETLWDQAIEEYNDSWGSDDADLTAFRDRGGKLLAWHGWADERIPPVGSIYYWEQVKAALGGRQEIDKVYRLFTAPGSPHCTEMSADANDLAVLVDWVENGVAPETLPAATERVFVKNCLYPQMLQYNGEGEVQDPDSWSCVENE
jgi:pimeloyl-ACP methyl ester carboxylesterase